MAYLDSINEKIVYKAKTHWIGCAWTIACFILGIIGLIFDIKIASVLILIGFIILIRFLIRAWTTELAITDKSIVAKWGLIRRESIEMRLQKVESIRVIQGIFGRIFGYGSIVVVGTGASSSPVPYIAEPLRFKKELDFILSDKENKEANNQQIMKLKIK